jgi:hypothetical protein
MKQSQLDKRLQRLMQHDHNKGPLHTGFVSKVMLSESDLLSQVKTRVVIRGMEGGGNNFSL